jgi:hypothetical protein
MSGASTLTIAGRSGAGVRGEGPLATIAEVLRPDHRLAGQDTVALHDLAHDVLGTPPEDLFPAWTLAQRQALESAGISPPMVELADTDLAAARWADQADAEWILLTPSVAAAHTTTVVRPSRPASWSRSPCSGIRTGPIPLPSPGSSTPRSPPTCRQAGAPSPVTCTTASESYAQRARMNPAITAPSRLRQRQTLTASCRYGMERRSGNPAR